MPTGEIFLTKPLLLPRPYFGLGLALGLAALLPTFDFRGAKASGADAYGQPNGGESTRAERRRTTAYYIDEGVNGCFKDRVLCGVNFEPCPVSLAGGRRHRLRIAAAAAAAANALEGKQDGGWREEERKYEEASAAAAERAENGEGGGGREEEEGEGEAGDEEEDAVVMGPSGLPADVVARKRLPKSLKPGDWLYFSQMGAYTASIATVTSSAVLEASYCYVASAPGVSPGGCTDSARVQMGGPGAYDDCLHDKQ